MAIVIGIVILALLALMVFAIVTGRFSPKEGMGCFVSVALVIVAVFMVVYMIVAHPDWYRLW